MTRSERVLLVLLVALVAFSPIFLGGVGRFEQEWSGRDRTPLERFLRAEGPWSILRFLALAVAAASVAVAAERAAAGEPSPLRLHRWILLPFLGLVVLGLLHLVPLPRPLLGLVAPSSAADLDLLLPGDGAWRPLTASPAGTRTFLEGMAAGGACLLGTLLLARRRTAALVLLGAVAGTFALTAAYGLAESHLLGNRVLEFPKKEDLGVTGTFLNRSHMAGAAAMALPAAAVLLFLALRERRRWIPAAAAAAGVLLVTVPLTRSRMGLASAAAGLAALGLLAARASRWRPWGKVLVAAALVAVVGAGVKAALDRVPELRKRFELASSERGFFDIRFPAWKATLDLAARHPATGTGMGSFETAIHETQTPDNPDELFFAHSEPLQLLAEGGPLALFLAALLAAGVLGAGVAAAGAEDRILRAAGCASAAGLAALLAGCTTEFHLHIPALGFAAAVLAGIPAGMAAGVPGPGPGAGARGLRPLVVVLVAVVLAGAGSVFHSSRGAARRGGARRAEQGGDSGGGRAAAGVGGAAAPGSAAARRSLSGALLSGSWSEADHAARAAEALLEADRAVDLDPFHPYGHWSRARALLAKSDEGGAVEALRRACSRAGGIGHLHFAAGKVLLLLSVRDRGLRGEALERLRYASACEPRFFSASLRALGEIGLPLRGSEALVPERAYALTNWTLACRSAGDFDAAFEGAVRLWAFDPSEAARRLLLSVARQAGRSEEADRVLAGGDPR